MSCFLGCDRNRGCEQQRGHGTGLLARGCGDSGQSLRHRWEVSEGVHFHGVRHAAKHCRLPASLFLLGQSASRPFNTPSNPIRPKTRPGTQCRPSLDLPRLPPTIPPGVGCVGRVEANCFRRSQSGNISTMPLEPGMASLTARELDP